MTRTSVLLVGVLLGLTSISRAVESPPFPADAVVNVRDYGAIPDDDKDDTASIQKAITANVDTGRVIFFPAGTYDISDTLVAKNKDGVWRAHLTLQGQDRTYTRLVLADQAPGFGDPKNPKPLLMTGSHWQEGDSPDGGGNKAFRNNVISLTLHTGRGNPGAIGIEWAVSNQGTLRDVQVVGSGVAGISMKRRIPGPGFITRSAVSGFDVGLDIGDLQYGVTLDDVTFLGQKTASIRLSENLVHARGLRIEGAPIQVLNAKAALTLFDSTIETRSKFAIQSEGNVLTNNVHAPGTEKLVQSTGKRPPLKSSFNLLRAEELWGYTMHDPGQWLAVGPRLEGEKDDTAAIQRAMDAGKKIIYFRNDRTYFLSDTVVIRGAVRKVVGMGSEISLGAAREPFSDKQNPRPLFRIDPVDGEDLTIENVFFNAQYPGEVIFENNSPKPLLIRSCAGWVGAEGHRRSYRNTAAATGKVFLEDVFLPGWSFTKQQVWARQFNPEHFESDGSEPQVLNDGGELWILGFKTEGAAPFIVTRNGGKTEVIGGYNYINATAKPVPVESVPYIVEDSSAVFTVVTENFRADNDYNVYVRSTSDGKTLNRERANLPARNGEPGDRSFYLRQLGTGRPPTTKPAP